MLLIQSISVFALSFEPNLTRDDKRASTHFVFQTDDIDKLYELLKSKGVLFKNPVAEAPGFVRFLTTTDPDGNTIEFGQYLRDPLAKRI